MIHFAFQASDFLRLVVVGLGGHRLPVGRARRPPGPAKRRRQFRNMDSWIPSSTAMCPKGRPLLSCSATVSCLNSSVKDRLIFVVIVHLSAPFGSLNEVSTNVEQGHIRSFCSAKTCSTLARILDFRPLALAVASDMGFPLGFFR